MTQKNAQFFDSHLIASIFLTIALCAPVAFASWTEDIRLTFGHHASQPEIMARGETVHVAFEYISPADSIFYMRSIDGGSSWSQAISLQAPGHLGSRHDLRLSENRALVSWADSDTNQVNWPINIAFSTSLTGIDWMYPSYVFHPFHGGEFSDFSVEIVGDSIYVIYGQSQSDSTGYRPMKFLRSTNLGQTWDTEVILGYLYYYTNPLNIIHCGGSLYIVWSGDFPPNFLWREVNGMVSTDGGRSWSEHFLISSDDGYVAQHSCVACDEETGNFAVAWMDFALSHGFPGDVFVRITTDGGQSWGEIYHATTHHNAANPAIALKGDSLYAVWSDRDTAYGFPNSEIGFARSTDFGASWSQFYRLTYAEGFSYRPWISSNLGRLHVVWWEVLRPPHYGDEVYYKRYDPEPISAEDVKPALPGKMTLAAYPNPFNSSVSISYSNLSGGEIKIYDIQGKLIKTFDLKGCEDGKINWDATDAEGNKICSGIYFARAEASQESQAIKLIYLK